MRIVSSAVMWWGGASNRRAPSSMPVGYASQTGYQYDSISRVAGQRELAPPSKFSNDGGFRNSVFKGIRKWFNSNIHSVRFGNKQASNGLLTERQLRYPASNGEHQICAT